LFDPDLDAGYLNEFVVQFYKLLHLSFPLNDVYIQDLDMFGYSIDGM